MYEIKHSKQQINIKTFAQSSGSLESLQVSSNVCARCFVSSVSIRSFFDDKFSLISTYSYDYVECLLAARDAVLIVISCAQLISSDDEAMKQLRGKKH